MGKENVQTHNHHHYHLCCFRITHLMMSLLLLLLSTSMQLIFFAQGNAVTGHAFTDPGSEERGSEAVEQSAIGSIPPSCNRKCRSCIRCTAVQLPVAPQIRRDWVRNVAYHARVDEISNYKPMRWKCKCGEYIFDP